MLLLVLAAGEAIAPARSCEKDLKSSESEKKLETRVIGPGLKPMPMPEVKNVSLKERGGRDIVAGRAEEVEEDLDVGGGEETGGEGWRVPLSAIG